MQTLSATVNDSNGYAGLGIMPLGTCTTLSGACVSPGNTSASLTTELAAGTWGLVVKAYPPYYGTFSLSATLTSTSTPVALTNGVGRVVSGAAGSMTYFTIAVPSGRTQLVIYIGGGTAGDPDLFVMRGTPPTEAVNEGSGATSGDDTITLNNPVAGTYYIGVLGYGTTTAYAGWTLTATY